MDENYYIEVACHQKRHKDERICGDVFLSERIRQEQRIIAVLSDGMGHGVKANVLATLSASMLLNFSRNHKPAGEIIEIIAKTLPVCSVRKMSYSTFTVVDASYNGALNLLEYDNPPSFLIQGGEPVEIEWTVSKYNGHQGREMQLRNASLRISKNDRIVAVTDGVTQSGLGQRYASGWGREALMQFVKETVKKNAGISAADLSAAVTNKAYSIEDYQPKDDLSCLVVYVRDPRKLLICTGPPFESSNDALLARKVMEFEGNKIICGATTADIIARELNKTITDDPEFTDPELPPIASMEGVDLITEGMLTLNKVAQLLKKHDDTSVLGKGPADQIVTYLLKSDEIHFLTGTRVNEAHQDPTLPVELDIRRNVVKSIARILETKYLKEVNIEFI